MSAEVIDNHWYSDIIPPDWGVNPMYFVGRAVARFDVRMDVSRPLHAIGFFGRRTCCPEIGNERAGVLKRGNRW